MTTIPKICLNMIVRNECKIIERLLISVDPLITTYCICDTGSTDNTIELIQKFFKAKNKTGIIFYEPFKDFGYNRTVSLQKCKLLNAEYILLLDADMIFEYNMTKLFSELTSVENKYISSYLINQGSNTYFFGNVRIVKNNMGFTYWGVTHEYVVCPENTYKKLIANKEIAFIRDIGDGGSKEHKFTRDIALLENALIKLPNNSRYTFYLANSYRDTQQHVKAIHTYEKVILLNGWIEEIWNSYFNIGLCWKIMADATTDEKTKQSYITLFINAHLDGFQLYPYRIEGLFEICKYYRCINKYYLAYMYYKQADSIRKLHTRQDFLFYDISKYDFDLDYEFSIIGYYVNNPDQINMSDLLIKLLKNNNLYKHYIPSILANYKFYSDQLSTYNTHDTIVNGLTESTKKLYDIFISENNYVNKDWLMSTPSILFTSKSTMLLCVRMINYKYDANTGTIHNINMMAILNNRDLNNVNSTWTMVNYGKLQYNINLDNMYIGLEDIRLFWQNNIIYYSANRSLNITKSNTNNKAVEHGIINITKSNNIILFACVCNQILITQNNYRTCENNWVMYPYPYNDLSKNHINMVYEWYPYTTLKVLPNISITNVLLKIDTTTFYQNIRGSCNGIYIEELNEVWFLSHVVSHENIKYYYHLFIATDYITGKIKRHTSYFTFEQKSTEFALGIQKYGDIIYISYSTMDSSAKFLSINIANINALQWYNN